MLTTKKMFKMFAAMALAFVATCSLTACGGDDEPETPEKEKTVKEATIDTRLYVNQTMLDTYDIVGKSFLSQELKFASTPVNVNVSGESVPMFPMELEGSSNAVPFISIMNISFTLKDGVDVPDKSDFAIAVVASGSITYSDGSEDSVSENGYSMLNKGVFADKIVEYTETLNKRFGRIKVTLDTTGLEIDTTSAE